MQYISYYSSPLGKMLLAADEAGLTGAWFLGQKYFAAGLQETPAERELPVFQETRRWLDAYFDRRKPDFMPPLHLIGTPFQIRVWEILQTIPYGQTVTYGDIAKALDKRMSAQAVGAAVGRNPISVIVPCHRVVGAKGSLTGYAGGLEKKMALLELEK